ncbi:hypothetical protein [Peterkaempfera griseoplana]|uniref:hypothetical protein n=1 Tax=Peterkaempfera griseoplana TaxID=66896 RepID=UPI0006E2DD61|nr:hypothetical protein [Peterkaempfera griseoplana]
MKDKQRWVSDPEVAEVQDAAITGKARRCQATTRLLVRRTRRPDDAGIPDGQGELSSVRWFHAVFSSQVLPLVQAAADHCRHTIVEQVVADLEGSVLGRPPSG